MADLQAYRSEIDRLIKAQDRSVILNGSHAHAAIVIERMLANAKNQVRVMTRLFDPRTYNVPETVQEARLMLGQRDRKFRVLVDDISNLRRRGNPYIEEMLDAYDNFEMREVPEALRDPISINFALMDDRGYRLERDRHGESATVRFGKTDAIDELTELFEDVWEQSSTLTSESFKAA